MDSRNIARVCGEEPIQSEQCSIENIDIVIHSIRMSAITKARESSIFLGDLRPEILGPNRDNASHCGMH